MKEIREVLGLLEAHAVAQHHGKLTSYGVYGIDQAEAEIKKIVLDMLPKKQVANSNRIEIDYICEGFNDCLAEIRKKIEGEL